MAKWAMSIVTPGVSCGGCGVTPSQTRTDLWSGLLPIATMGGLSGGTTKQPCLGISRMCQGEQFILMLRSATVWAS